MRANLIVALVGMLYLAGCGGGTSTIASTGGGGSSGGGTTTPTGANVQAVTVDSGPSVIANSNSPAVNTLYVSVTICAPGSTSNCQTIDHIQVDTGSSGLRILNSALSISLPLDTDSNGNAIAECVQFVDGSSWGPLRKADIKISGEVASNQAVHIIGDTTYTIPTACSNSGTAENTVQTFGANGILGVSPFLQDCGGGCTVQGSGIYYTCPTATTCADSAMPLTQQLLNPVAGFSTDNNGIIIQLGSVSGSSVRTVSGYLIFGIGTQSNNALGNATVFRLNSDGSLSTTYNGKTLSQSFIDSGSNGLFFHDPSINTCKTNTGFYCPSATLNLTATLVGTNSASSSVSFSVVNADNLFSTSGVVAAVPGLAGDSASTDPNSNSSFTGTNTFDWGLPFHYGRSVYTAIEGKNTSDGGMGPYFAF